MNIENQITQLATELIQSIKVNLDESLREQITGAVISKIATIELDTVINSFLNEKIDQKLTLGNFTREIESELSKLVESIGKEITSSLMASANTKITLDIAQRLSTMDFNSVLNEVVKNQLGALFQKFDLPDGSIPSSAIDFSSLKITGDIVNGGIIENFGSTGIEDRASFVQLTLMDHATVFEGAIHTPEMQVKGDSMIEGNLTVNGDITLLGGLNSDSTAFISLVESSVKKTTDTLTELLNDDWFANYSRVIFDKIKEDGLDLDRITQNGRDIVKDRQLGYHITDTNIQRLGMVKDFQTQGESLLSDTLYTTNKRIGINTMEPSAVLAVWDEECEVIVAKRRLDTAFIGTQRRQPVIVGSNNKENIVLDVEGGATIQNLTIGKVSFSSSASLPSHDAPKGDVLFNETPEIGQPMGWVSLGGARWALFGIVG